MRWHRWWFKQSEYEGFETHYDAKIIKIRYQGGRVMNSLSQGATNNVQSITPLQKELQSWAEESVVVVTEKMIGEIHNIISETTSKCRLNNDKCLWTKQKHWSWSGQYG